jgi:uncharacterized membrane protein YdjX (TVP38/TMEM64 family)
MTWIRLGVVALVLAAVAAAVALGLPRMLSLDHLRAERTTLIAFVHAHPWGSVLAYVALYTAVVGFSIPGSLVMTLSGGFLFGVIEGTTAAVTGVSLGSILMFLLAQTAVGDSLRGWISRKSPLVHKLETEVREHPFTSILTLRLIPAFPLWLVNLSAGFVRMKLLPYALATVVGVVPSTLLYGSVGAGLEDLFDTVGPGQIMGVLRHELVWPAVGLIGLAALPLAARWWPRRRAKAAALRSGAL